MQKTAILFAVFSLISISIFSQASCDLERKTDEFTGQKTVSSKEFKIMESFPIIGNRKPWDLNIMFVYSNDSIRIFLDHASQNQASTINRISFKFSDDKVMIKNNPINGIELNRMGYNFQFTIFGISKDELKQFANSELVKTRVEFYNPRDYDPLVEKELKSKKALPVKEGAACILQEFK